MDAKTYNEIFIESDERCLCPRCGVNYMERELEKMLYHDMNQTFTFALYVGQMKRY